MKEEPSSTITGSSVTRHMPVPLGKSDKHLMNTFLWLPAPLHVPGAARGTAGFFPTVSVNVFSLWSNHFCNTIGPALQWLLYRASAQKPVLVLICCCDAGITSLSPALTQWEYETLVIGFSKGFLGAEPAEAPRVGLGQQVPGDRLLPSSRQCWGWQPWPRAWG